MVDAVDVLVTEFKKTLLEESLGLVTYATNYSYCGGRVNRSDVNNWLSFNYREVQDDLAQLSRKPIIGGTSISAGIDDRLRVLTQSGAVRPLPTR